MSNRLVNIPAQAADSVPTSMGIINAPQSALTFAGAPTAVTLVVKVLSAGIPFLKDYSQSLLIILSLLIGMLIYWQSAGTPTTNKEKSLDFTYGLINSFAIAAAALGISDVT